MRNYYQIRNVQIMANILKYSIVEHEMLKEIEQQENEAQKAKLKKKKKKPSEFQGENTIDRISYLRRNYSIKLYKAT